MKYFLLMLSLTSMIAAQDIAVATYKIRMKKDLYMQTIQQTDDGALFAKCKELTRQSQAYLDDIVFLRSKSAARASVDSTMELQYPCEPEPSSYGSFEKKEPPPREFVVPISMLYIPPAFTTRNVGTLFTIEATAEAHQKIDLRFDSSKISYIADKVFFTHRDHRGNLLEIIHPIFYTQPINITISCRNGEPKLVGVTHPCDSSGNRDASELVLHFIIAEKTS